MVAGLRPHRTGLGEWLRTYWIVLVAPALVALAVGLVILIGVMSRVSVS
jgi:hypothetical protein